MEEAYNMTKRGIDVLSLLGDEQRLLLPQSVASALSNGTITETELIIATMRSERILRQTTRIGITGVVSSASIAGTYLVFSELDK